MNLDLTYKFLKYIALVIIIYFGLKYSCNSNEDNIDLMIFALSIVVVYAIIENMQTLFNSSNFSNTSCTSDSCKVEKFTNSSDIDDKLSKFFETSLDEIKNIKNSNIDEYNDLLNGYNETVDAKNGTTQENFESSAVDEKKDEVISDDQLLKKMSEFFETNVDDLSSLDESEFEELKSGYLETIGQSNSELISESMKSFYFKLMKMIYYGKKEKLNELLAKHNKTTTSNIVKLRGLSLEDYNQLVNEYYNSLSENDKIKNVFDMYPQYKSLINEMIKNKIDLYNELKNVSGIKKSMFDNIDKVNFDSLHLLVSLPKLKSNNNKFNLLKNKTKNIHVEVLNDIINGIENSQDSELLKQKSLFKEFEKLAKEGNAIPNDTLKNLIKDQMKDGSLSDVVSEEYLANLIGETVLETLKTASEESSAEESSAEESSAEESSAEESSAEESSAEESSAEESSAEETSAEESSVKEETIDQFVNRLKNKNLNIKSDDNKLQEFTLKKNRFINDLLESQEDKPRFVVFNMDGKRAIYRKLNDSKYIRDDDFPIDDLLLSKQDLVNLNNIGVDLDLLKNNDLDKLKENITKEIKKESIKQKMQENMDNANESNKLELDLINNQKELDRLENLEKIEKEKLSLEKKKDDLIKMKKSNDKPKAFSSFNIERGEMRSESGVMDNDMDYNDFNRLPLDDGIGNKEYEYGYSFLPPKNWYPAPVHPPLCVSNSSCPVCPLHSDSSVVDLKDFDHSRRITQPDNINTEYIKNKLNSGK